MGHAQGNGGMLPAHLAMLALLGWISAAHPPLCCVHLGRYAWHVHPTPELYLMFASGQLHCKRPKVAHNRCKI
jgi:hypothetical protein